MNLNKSYIKKRLYLKPADIQDAKGAFYIDVLLTKTFEVIDYVDTKKDEKIYTINRQEFNPYFIDFEFFSTLNRVKSNQGNDLTTDMINYLRQKYAAEYIVDSYKISYIGRLTESYTNNNPNDPLNNHLQFIIENSSRKFDLPSFNNRLLKKFRLSGTSYFDGVYIYTSYLKEPAPDNRVSTLMCKPDKPLQGNTFVYNNWEYVAVNPNVATIQIISDNLNNTAEEASFNDENWDLKTWFNDVGYNKLTLNKDTTTNETELEKIEKLNLDSSSLISKAYFFPISINK